MTHNVASSVIKRLEKHRPRCVQLNSWALKPFFENDARININNKNHNELIMLLVYSSPFFES